MITGGREIKFHLYSKDRQKSLYQNVKNWHLHLESPIFAFLISFYISRNVINRGKLLLQVQKKGKKEIKVTEEKK